MNLANLRIRREADFPLVEMDNLPEALKDTQAKLRVRLLTPGELRDVGEAQFEVTMRAGENGELVQEMRNRRKAALEALFARAVVGWSGIFEDEAGTVPVPFGPEGKRAIVDACPIVLEFAEACHNKLAAQVAGQEVAQGKNCSAGQAG